MEILGINDHGEVVRACITVSAQWRKLGAALGVKEPTMAVIEHNHGRDAERCFSAVIEKWLRRPRDAVRDDVEPTWKSLCEALLLYIDGTLAREIGLNHNCYSAVIKATSRSRVPPAFLSKSCGCGQCTIEEWKTGRVCQKAIEDSRPKLLIVNPNYPEASEIVKFETSYDRQAELCYETGKLAQNFSSVASKTWINLKEAVDERRYSISDITHELGSLLQRPLPTISNLHELQNHFHLLRVSWFNFEPLYLLCKNLFQSQDPTHPLIKDWDTYLALFENYCSDRNLKVFVNVFFQVEKRNVFLLEVDECYYQFTLSDIRALRRSLCTALGVPSACLHLVTVGKGSLIIYFYYCFSDYLVRFGSLTTKQLKNIAEIKNGRILSLIDLNHQFKYNIQSHHEILTERAKKDISFKTSIDDSITSVWYSCSTFLYVSLDLPALVNHLDYYCDDMQQIVGESQDLVSLVNTYNDVRSMPAVHTALSDIKVFIEKAFEYIDKVGYVPYYFQCTFDGESHWSDYQNCKTRLEKSQKCFKECLVIYETLKRYCSIAQKSCDTVHARLEEKTKSAMDLRTVGTMADVFTFWIGTAFAPATTVAARAAEYVHSADNFKSLSRSFSRLNDHAVKLSCIAERMIQGLGSILYHLEYHKAVDLLADMKFNGRYAYAHTSARISSVSHLKDSLVRDIIRSES